MSDSSEGSFDLTVMSSVGHKHRLEMVAGGKWGSNPGRGRATEQVNICLRWQEIAVRAVVGVRGGAAGGVWTADAPTHCDDRAEDFALSEKLTTREKRWGSWKRSQLYASVLHHIFKQQHVWNSENVAPHDSFCL